jgi:formylmethanofuran dehydrogenase subunit C
LASVILADLANQTVGNVVVTTVSSLTWDIAEAVGGAATVDATSEYVVDASHTITGGITVTGGTLNVTGANTLTSGVILAGGNVIVDSTCSIVGAISDTAAGNTIAMGAAGVITGTIDLDDGACTWTGVGTATINATSNLRLGGAATELTIVINDGAGTQTITATAAISCAAMTMTNCSAFAMGTFAHTFAAGFTQTAGTPSGTGSITINATGPLKLSTALVGLDISLTGGTITLGANLSCEGITINCTAFVCAAYTVTVADGIVHTAGTITSTGTWTMTATGPLNLVCTTIPLVLNDGAGTQTFTAAGAISVKTLTMTNGTAFAFGAYAITIAGSAVQSAGTLTSTGLWTITATGTLTLQTAIVGAYFNITGGTCTLGDALDIAGLQVQSGASIAGAAQSVSLAVGRITGYGSVANLAPAVAIHAAPGLADGGSNTANVIFDPTPMPLVI